jgi:hypothetical protein
MAKLGPVCKLVDFFSTLRIFQQDDNVDESVDFSK